MTRWQRHLAVLAAVLVAILVLFQRDARDMAGQWWNSSTYQHCLFILPIIAWLIWQRRAEVAPIAPAAWAPGLVFVALAAFVWLLGEAGSASLIRHAALVLMIQASVLAVLGPAIVRALLFPLFYLVFLVPFGDIFVPPLQTITAKMVIGLVRLSGLPAHIDGVFITTQAGWFEVAEACSGVKFLVAMIAYGALVAHVCFTSWPRRFAFMALCVVAPILANGVRAFATIYAAHLTSAEAATSFDHIVYGWFFFAFVMAAVTALGWRYFDRRVGDPWLSAWRPSDHRVAALLPVALATTGIAALPGLWSATVLAQGRSALPHPVGLPVVPGWTVVPATGTPWTARFDGADHRLYGRYRDASGENVDVAIALYGGQGEGRDIVGFGQGAADPQGKWRWSADAAAPPGGRAERLIGPAALARTAWTFYVLGTMSTGDRLTVKRHTLSTRLFGGDQRAAIVILSAEDRPGAPAAPLLARFRAALGPPETAAARLFAAAQGAR